MKLFSAFGAASLLERDRQTIARALRHVAPDGRSGKSPRWRLPTIIKALDASNRTNNGGGGHGRLDEIADELERLHGELDAAIALVKSIPDLDSKEPHSRAAMRLIERIDALYRKANELMFDPHTLLPYVSGPIVGTVFRKLLVAIYGPEVEIDGVRMFTDAQIDGLGLR